MHRFHVPPGAVEGDRVTLRDREAHHLAVVLRTETAGIAAAAMVIYELALRGGQSAGGIPGRAANLTDRFRSH